MPKRNTYSYLIEVLQHVIQQEHDNFQKYVAEKYNFPSSAHSDLTTEVIEDAFEDDDIQHVYKTAKLAYFDLINNDTKRYGLVDLNEEKKLEKAVINAEIFLCEKKLALLQHKRET